MKKKNLIILIIISVLLILNTCNIVGPSVTDHKILGKWNWLESFGGYGGDFRTPENTGYNIEIEFTKLKKYYSYKDHVLERDTYYDISQKNIYSDEKMEELLKIDNDVKEQIIQFITADTLILIENCLDCYQHKYLRKSE